MQALARVHGHHAQSAPVRKIERPAQELSEIPQPEMEKRSGWQQPATKGRQGQPDVVLGWPGTQELPRLYRQGTPGQCRLCWQQPEVRDQQGQQGQHWEGILQKG